MDDPPQFSFILLVYNMPREAPRTLYTLGTPYQRDADRIPYEVIVVENGSTMPLDPAAVAAFGPQFRYLFHETDSPSPVEAIHRAVMMSRGEHVVVMNDGARMLSPGIVANFARSARAFDRAVTAVPGYHLGPPNRPDSTGPEYNRQVEDRLLESVPWREDGYRLFDISRLAPSSRKGWFLPIAESNCISMPREVYEAIGGVCQQFQTPGGGLIALDFFKKAWEYPAASPVMLLGEGTFHQYHGGTLTNASDADRKRRKAEMIDEYERIRGEPYTSPTRKPHFLGQLPDASAPFVGFSGRRFEKAHPKKPVPGMEEPSPARKKNWFRRITGA